MTSRMPSAKWLQSCLDLDVFNSMNSMNKIHMKCHWHGDISIVQTALRCLWKFIANTGPLSTNQTDTLPKDLVKSRSYEIGCYSTRIALKFDKHLDSATTGVPVKCQSDWKKSRPESRRFGTSRDLAVRRPSAC